MVVPGACGSNVVLSGDGPSVPGASVVPGAVSVGSPPLGGVLSGVVVSGVVVSGVVVSGVAVPLGVTGGAATPLSRAFVAVTPGSTVPHAESTAAPTKRREREARTRTFSSIGRRLSAGARGVEVTECSYEPGLAAVSASRACSCGGQVVVLAVSSCCSSAISSCWLPAICRARSRTVDSLACRIA